MLTVMLAHFPLQMITMDNAEEYVDLMFDFCMHTGIQKQMEAFRGKFKR
jgi:E3 ubiquitin-protein ligase HECTD1